MKFVLDDEYFYGKANNSTILLELTTNIANLRVSNNIVRFDSLLEFIKNVHDSLTTAAEEVLIFLAGPRHPAVPFASSMSGDFLICLEDGKTPEQYRVGWELPLDYPMVAPSYAAKRSELAKKMGLGMRFGQPH